MTVLSGFKLDFPDGTTFRATSEISVTHETTPLHKLNGFQNLITIYNEYIDNGGQDGRSDSNYSGVFLGFGAGVHTIRIRVYQFKGNGQTWGDSDTSDTGDSALSLMQTLNRAITTTRADSDDPAILEVGEYSTGGKYDPIPVVIGSTDFTHDPGNEDEVSSFSGNIEFYDSIDLSQAVSATARRS